MKAKKRVCRSDRTRGKVRCRHVALPGSDFCEHHEPKRKRKLETWPQTVRRA